MRMPKGLFRFAGILALWLGLAGCSEPPKERVDSVIDWVDFVQWNDQFYMRLVDAVLADPSDVGKRVGKVAFNVADNVHSADYKLRNGDAAFLEPGTRLYEVRGVPAADLLAVPDDAFVNGYRLYAPRGAYADLSPAYAKLDKAKIQAVDIYRDESSSPARANRLEGEAAKPLLAMLDQSLEQVDDDAAGSTIQPVGYIAAFDIGEPVSPAYRIENNGSRYFWSPDHTSLLPEGIEAYLKP